MATTEAEFSPDYLLVGHVCRDVVRGRRRTGGTVLYAGLTAAKLGRRVAIVTACEAPAPTELRGMQVAVAPSGSTTTLEHEDSDQGRRLWVISKAASIDRAVVPEGWKSTPVVHLAPIVDEIEPKFGDLFPKSRVVATPQGWLRKCFEGAPVQPFPGRAQELHGTASMMVLSEEDLGGNLALAEMLAGGLEVLVVTAGAAGYRLYHEKRCEYFPAFPSREVDPIGAGDVFAAAYFIRVDETGDPRSSGRFAAMAAAMSVEGAATSRIPTRPQIEDRLEAARAA